MGRESRDAERKLVKNRNVVAEKDSEEPIMAHSGPGLEGQLAAQARWKSDLGIQR